MIQYIIFELLLLVTYGNTYDLETCFPLSICSIERSNRNPLDLDFGDLLKYNIFVSQNFTNDANNPSDVEGRVAVGGNHHVPLGHSIGNKLCARISDVSQLPDY